jgi:hypothetical protein
MFELDPKTQRVRIDLESVRDTLLYIESDLRHAKGLETVAAAVAQVLVEIGRVEEELGVDRSQPIITALFVPARL